MVFAGPDVLRHISPAEGILEEAERLRKFSVREKVRVLVWVERPVESLVKVQRLLGCRTWSDQEKAVFHRVGPGSLGTPPSRRWLGLDPAIRPGRLRMEVLS